MSTRINVSREQIESLLSERVPVLNDLRGQLINKLSGLDSSFECSCGILAGLATKHLVEPSDFNATQLKMLLACLRMKHKGNQAEFVNRMYTDMVVLQRYPDADMGIMVKEFFGPVFEKLKAIVKPTMTFGPFASDYAKGLATKKATNQRFAGQFWRNTEDGKLLRDTLIEHFATVSMNEKLVELCIAINTYYRLNPDSVEIETPFCSGSGNQKMVLFGSNIEEALTNMALNTTDIEEIQKQKKFHDGLAMSHTQTCASLSRCNQILDGLKSLVIDNVVYESVSLDLVVYEKLNKISDEIEIIKKTLQEIDPCSQQ